MKPISHEMKPHPLRDETHLLRDENKKRIFRNHLTRDENYKRIYETHPPRDETHLLRDENRHVGDFFYLLRVFLGN